MWNSARDLKHSLKVAGGKVAPAQCTVKLEMWDSDPGVLDGADDFIGRVEVDPAKLLFNKPTPVVLLDDEGKVVKGHNGQCSLYICLITATSPKKSVYFIRHGESTWNAAQDGMLQKGQIGNVTAMAGSRDNPLSE